MDMERLRWNLQVIGTTEAVELDCDTVFELLEAVVEQAAAGTDVRGLFPDIMIHLDHCPGCRDLFDTLVVFVESEAS